MKVKRKKRRKGWPTMGLWSYFKLQRPIDRGKIYAPYVPSKNGWIERTLAGLINLDDFRQPPNRFNFAFSRNSSSESFRGSLFRSNFTDDLRHEVMINYLYQQQCSRLWIGAGAGITEGVLLRRYRGLYMVCPTSLVESVLERACLALDIQCAMTINSRIIKTFLSWSPDAMEVPMLNGMRIQIMPSINELARARKYQCAAFLAAECLLVIWDDDPLSAIERAKIAEREMLGMIWRRNQMIIKNGGKIPENFLTDEEKGLFDIDKRPIHLLNAYLVSLVVMIVTVSLGSAWRQLTIESSVEDSYVRLGLALLFPIQVFFSLFFAQVLVGCMAQVFGPIRQLAVNSKYYSAIPPFRLRTPTLPHITIQCPVYKEGLEGVIEPTVDSLQRAIATYELQGGSANLFINDDGLQIIPEEERMARIDFYTSHRIGWVARPKHGENGFRRRGKFKKASNMNFALMVACKVEDRLKTYRRDAVWSQIDEAFAYERALEEILQEDGRAWADGNIRIGDYILLVDSDTRVPYDCLLDAASEMELSPNVGIIQFSSGVMQVVHTYFENGITFFTNLIYSAIRYTVSNGDVAPFVGHNAVLRWAAIQEVSYTDEDGYEKFWSESHVSEDFDMSLRLQCRGYIVRLAAWADEDFKEGVSLTVYDELARWEKYAFGCNELLFHPIRNWSESGLFTPLFLQFLHSNVRLTSKITILSYIGTYYAIGAAWIMTSINYFIMGWFNGYLDKYYIDSWKVWFSIIIVFNGLGNIGLAVMRYRVGERTLAYALYENFKWTSLLAIYLGGLSLHISQALLSHAFEIDTSWGATSKEAEFSNFFIEVPRVIKRFKYSIIFSLLFLIGMVIAAVAPFIPSDWHITDFVAILPMATVASSHFLLPLALNPALMTFSW
ncbi:glycosyl transferase family group 2-domain-containing protein [Daldinia sp. FL1419]|nr:glycosyl transferase family group 2-domain-containing protein [Daldinia sp. FL1419]